MLSDAICCEKRQFLKDQESAHRKLKQLVSHVEVFIKKLSEIEKAKGAQAREWLSQTGQAIQYLQNGFEVILYVEIVVGHATKWAPRYRFK